MAEIPQLYTCAGGGQRLMVDGRPYTLFAGECHNSASGGRRAFADALDRARALGMNTVLAPVTWELLEPAEGEFDFGQVDMMLELARERGLRLGVLWFGAYKMRSATMRPRGSNAISSVFAVRRWCPGRTRFAMPSSITLRSRRFRSIARRRARRMPAPTRL